MIGRWAKAAALLTLGCAAVVNLGIASALLVNPTHDLPGVLAQLAALAGPDPRLALGGRDAILGGVVAGGLAGAAALLLGPAVGTLSRPGALLLGALVRIPALTVLLVALLAAILLLDRSGPVTACLAGFAVATAPLGPRLTLAIVLLPAAVAIVARASRRLDPAGFDSLASLGVGPLRRLFTIALPGVLPAAIKAAVAGFCVAAGCLFVAAWPVPARHDAVAAMAAMVQPRPLAELAFCGAVVLAILAALLSSPRQTAHEPG